MESKLRIFSGCITAGRILLTNFDLSASLKFFLNNGHSFKIKEFD